MKRYLPVVPFLILAPLHADVPATVHHQGRIAVNNVNFTGAGSFKFLLFTDSDADHASGNETAVWKNDDASPTDLTEPAAAVSLTVTNGLYSLRLGEAPQVSLPADLIPPAGEQLYLRTWFDNGINGSQQLTPDQQLASVPFALHANIDLSNASLSELNNDVGFITEESLITTTETDPVAPDLATLNSGPGVFSETFTFSQTFPDVPEIVLGSVANLTNPVVSNVSTTGFDLTFDYDTSTQTSTLPATTPWTEFDAVPIGGILGVFYIDGETQTNTYDTGVDKENVFGGPTDVVVTDVTDFPDLVFRTLNGSSWGTPTTLGNVLAVSPTGTPTIDAAIINGRPAVAYLEHAPLTNTPNPISPSFVTINSTTAVNLTYRTMDPGATSWQSAVTASPLLALNNTSSGSYTAFAGNPPLIALESISGRPAILSSSNGFTSFLRANDADGTSWPPSTSVEVNSQPVQAVGLSNLLEIGGNPAFAYMEPLTPATTADPALALRFVSATAPSGTSWNAPVTLWSISQDDITGGLSGSSLQEISIELRLIDSQPAVAFTFPISSLTGLFYTRSQDASGTAWQPATEIASHGAGYPASGVITTARLSDDSGLPRISFNQSPDIVEISGDQADGGTWSTPSTIATGVNGTHQSGSLGQADFLLTSSASSFQSPLSISNVTLSDDVIYRAPVGGSIDAVTNPSPSLTWTATDPADVELVNQSLSLNGTDLSISAGNTIDLSPAIISDHGSLTGLLDDDHPQYLLGDGSEPFGGNLDLGGNDLTGIQSLTVTGTVSLPSGSVGSAALASDVMLSGDNISLLANDAGYIPSSGNAILNGELCVNDDVLTSGDFKYKTPRTVRKIIPPTEFDEENPGFSGIVYFRENGQSLRPTSGSSHRVVASFTPPAGATLTRVTLLATLGSGSGINAQLRSVSLDPDDPGNAGLDSLINTVPNGVSNDKQAIELLTSSVVVPADTYYTLKMNLSSNSNLRGAVIEYTTDTVQP